MLWASNATGEGQGLGACRLGGFISRVASLRSLWLVSGGRAPRE